MPADPAEAEGAEGSNAAPAPSKPAPTKVAYHPNVRCLRGGGGVGPVIVGPMYRVGEGCVSEEMATEEEKARGPSRRQRILGASRWRGLICAAGQRLTSNGCVAPTASLI